MGENYGSDHEQWSVLGRCHFFDAAETHISFHYSPAKLSISTLALLFILLLLFRIITWLKRRRLSASIIFKTGY
jgi:hypothetical protein